MRSTTHSHSPIFGRNSSPANLALGILLTLLFLFFLLLFLTLTAPSAQGQIYRVVYNFTGGPDGANPEPLVMDTAGNLYGTTSAGGRLTVGTVFKFRRGLLTTLYNFTQTSANCLLGFPLHSIMIGPNGSLYGTETYGGLGRGSVFNLRPPATACGTALCLWHETELYRFGGPEDGRCPTGQLAFDAQGNIYGATTEGGPGSNCYPPSCGTVYELTPVQGSPVEGWRETILYDFSSGYSAFPSSGVIFGPNGSLFGATLTGNYDPDGAVFTLTPSGTGWQFSDLYALPGPGEYPNGNILFDASGNLYGSTAFNFDTIFQLQPSGGGWNFTMLYNLGESSDNIDFVYLAMDTAGNLYGTTYYVGAYGNGSVFKLSPGSEGWTYTSLHDFCGGGPPCSDGANGAGLVVDAAGNLYGSANNGGANGAGVIWEITP